MLDFHSKEIMTKFFSRFTERINKSIEELSIPFLICKIAVGSKLDFKKLMIYLWF